MHSYAFSGGLRPPNDRNRADQTTGGMLELEVNPVIEDTAAAEGASRVVKK
jgi:hypothetical protein